MKKLILIIGVVAFFLSSCAKQEDQKIIVFGSSQTSITSNQWIFHFSLEFKEKTRELVTENYNKSKEEIYKALKIIGVDDKDIKTENFSLSPWYEWEKNVNVKKGHILSHQLFIKKNDFKIISEAVTVLGTFPEVSIGSISHLLKKETEEEEMAKLYALSFANAKIKIEALAHSAGKEIKRIELISEENYSSEESSTETYSAQWRSSLKAVGNTPEESSALKIALLPLEIKISKTIKVIASFK